jgi:two-component system sensor histidine kinase BaeS
MPTAKRRWQLGRLDPVMVDADRERLGLAVDAMLENAVRHTSDGDVIQLSVESAGDGSAARMIISDTGTGIPAAELDHIFERFQSGSELGDGRTGLGLALVRAVARAHGGEALVRSVPGQGSEFELRLAVTAPAAVTAPVAGVAPAADTAPGTGVSPAASLTATGHGEAASGGCSAPASAPSPPGQPGPGQAALEDISRGRRR